MSEPYHAPTGYPEDWDWGHDPAMVGAPRYDRIPGDAYFTIDQWVTEALLDTVKLREPIWECAAGAGDMAEIIKRRYDEVVATDIADYGYPLLLTRDFLKSVLSRRGSIVTNPPYTLAEEFVRHALDLTKEQGGQVAMLLRNEFDSAKSRSDLFADHPAFTMKLVLRKRPRWKKFQKGDKGPRHNFAWFVWDWRNEKPPTIRYAA